MYQSVYRGQRHGRLGKDISPLRERRVGRDGQALALVAFGDQLEQHRRFRPGHGARSSGHPESAGRIGPAWSTRRPVYVFSAISDGTQS